MFELVGAWLGRAHQAAARATYVLDVSVPQPLPRPRAPRSVGVLKAMKQTLETVQARAGANLAERSADPIHGRLAPMMSGVQSALDSAGALSAPSVSDDVKAVLGQTLQGGLDHAYQVGQLLAIPELLVKTEPVAPAPAVHDSTTVGLFLPGDPGFDPWCLTDPIERREKQESQELTALIERFWEKDPEPAKTLAIQAEIAGALEQGAADFMPREMGPLTRRADGCPWPPILYAKASLVIAGKAACSGGYVRLHRRSVREWIRAHDRLVLRRDPCQGRVAEWLTSPSRRRRSSSSTGSGTCSRSTPRLAP